jgi:hypothetical protein
MKIKTYQLEWFTINGMDEAQKINNWFRQMLEDGYSPWGSPVTLATLHGYHVGQAWAEFDDAARPAKLSSKKAKRRAPGAAELAAAQRTPGSPVHIRGWVGVLSPRLEVTLNRNGILPWGLELVQQAENETYDMTEQEQYDLLVARAPENHFHLDLNRDERELWNPFGMQPGEQVLANPVGNAVRGGDGGIRGANRQRHLLEPLLQFPLPPEEEQ